MLFPTKHMIIACFVSIITLTLCTSSASHLTVLADDRYPGVTTGQFLQWEVNIYVSSSNDTELVNTLLFLLPYHAFVNITVLGISESYLSEVRFHMISYNATNILYDQVYELDVASGIENYAYMDPWLVATNLGISDTVYTGGPRFGAVEINETMTTDFLGTQVQANRAFNHESYTNVSQYGIVYNSTSWDDYSFERITGALLRSNEENLATRSNNTDTLVTIWYRQFSLISMIPLVPEFPSFLVLPLFMIATLLVITTYRRRHLN